MGSIESQHINLSQAIACLHLQLQMIVKSNLFHYYANEFAPLLKFKFWMMYADLTTIHNITSTTHSWLFLMIEKLDLMF